MQGEWPQQVGWHAYTLSLKQIGPRNNTFVEISLRVVCGLSINVNGFSGVGCSSEEGFTLAKFFVG